MKFAADRVLGLALIGLAAFAAYQASRFQVIFSYEPVGPKAFPMLLSAVLAGLSLVLVIRPGENGAWPSRTVALKLVLVLGGLLAYALLFTRAGYVLSTGLAVLALARLFGAGWGKAMIGALLMAVVSYYLFTRGLGISLPSGHWLPNAF